MKKFLAALVTVVTLSLFPISTVQADTPNCVTRDEYGRIDVGMTRHFVHHVFDFNGTVISRHGDIEVRQYQMCSGSGYLAAQVFYVKIEGYHWLVYDKRRF